MLRAVRMSLLLSLSAAGVAAQSRLPDPGMPAGFPLRYSIDPAHSQIEFVARFMGLSTVRGAFAAFGGDILYQEGQPSHWSVSAIILAKSINTNSPTRDRHLRSPDFLGVEAYPFITFRSTAVRPSGSGFALEGDFTLHGVTRHIILPVTMLNPPVADAWGNARMTFQTRYRVSRKEYGIQGTAFWNSEFDPGRMAVADEIEIELLISAIIPNVETWTNPVGDSLLAAIHKEGVGTATDRLRAAARDNPKFDSVPDFPFVMVGQKLVMSGEKRDGAALYDALVAIRPGSPTIAFRAGEAWLSLGDTARARDLFRTVLQLDSTDTSAAEWLRYLDSSGR